MDSKDEQWQKALSPINVTLLGIVIDVKDEQSQKAPSPIEVTPFGMIMDSKDEQWQKALSPINVTLLGIVIDSKDEQQSNAYSPISVTESPLYSFGTVISEGKYSLKYFIREGFALTLYESPILLKL